ncbi:hypothetical protein ACJ72_08557 [Emergomyces africanus]|uniref:Uncharacterized protein n=1 Tax=Emergomyces africanus TaxID=1955775 RepID=A0A1B7NJZ5_9EURO|nr:hypothetical protein ACJ72_08557 [Emergomyces africanus]
MGGEPLLGSANPSILSRKRSFSEVDGCVQTANTQDNDGIIVPAPLYLNGVARESTTTNASEMRPEIHPSIETVDTALPHDT